MNDAEIFYFKRVHYAFHILVVASRKVCPPVVGYLTTISVLDVARFRRWIYSSCASATFHVKLPSDAEKTSLAVSHSELSP